MIEFIEPQRRLSEVVLPGSLGESVEQLLAEWANSEKLIRFGLQPRNRVLLHGPSGNGKTTLAEAIACELNREIGFVRLAELISTYSGGTTKNVGAVFNEVRRHKDCVLFFDEADSILGSRTTDGNSSAKDKNGTVNAMLMELDKLPKESVVIFATNFEEVLDVAMRRRVNLSLEMPSPDLEDMERLIGAMLKQNPLLKRPLQDFDVRGSRATSFAELEAKALDHARRYILASDDPLEMTGKPRSHYLRQGLLERGVISGTTDHTKPAWAASVGES